jgi:glycosyltransferase involved in cell wall biosynthesis
MNRSPRDVICFGTDWYSPSKVSIRQIVDVLHERGSRVLWVNPVPIRFPRTGRRELWDKVQNKARTHSRLMSRPSAGLYVYSPFYLPVFRGPAFFINRAALTVQVLFLRAILGMWHPLVFGSRFTAWFALPAIRDCPLVFHFADKISAFRDVSGNAQRRQVLVDMERTLINSAILATCSSTMIHEYVLGVADGDTKKVRYLPHAMRASLFGGLNRDDDAVPADIAELPRPIAGYFGSLTHTNDLDAFRAAATALPGWSFVFIGRTVGDYSTLESLANVKFLGPRPHEMIPAYGAAFDVCFMGWKPHEWISNCSPVKTLEYLALGKPIVCSSSIDELTGRFPGLITMTSSNSEFVDALVRAVADDTVAHRDARRTAVADSTWERRVDEILACLAEQGARYAV